jgi:uncharacterized membrane protein (UPF0127 family)
MNTIHFVNINQPLPTPLHALYCDSFLGRLLGLMFRSSLAPEQGLLLVESRESRIDTAIHMLQIFQPMKSLRFRSYFGFSILYIYTH